MSYSSCSCFVCLTGPYKFEYLIKELIKCKTVTWMQCKSLWIKASAKCINVNVSCFRAVKIWFFEYNSLILTTGCSTWHLKAKNSLRIWELELLLSTKMAEAIRSSVTAWNWVTVQWPGSYRGFQDRFHSEQASQGSIKEVESLCCASGAEAGFKKQTHECCQHCFRGCRSGRSACQCSDHTPHTATSRFAWPSSQK